MVKTPKSETGIDPKRPWKLPWLGAGFPPYGCKKSKAEWKALLARASKGDAETAFEIASLYDDGCKDRRGGILVRRSAAKAFAWFRRAAEQGSPSAQTTLGVILGGHYGVKRDSRRALFWLKKAFRGGDTSCAPRNIAITYRERGNFRAAVRWFKRAAELGDDGILVQLGVHSYWGV